MPRPIQLHVMLSEEEMSSLRSLADALGTSVSDPERILVKAGAVAPGSCGETMLVLDRRTLAAYVRNVRALGHLLNQSTHALNAIAKAVRESGIDALDLTEAMEGVSWGLDVVRQDAAEVRRQGAELTGKPVVFGE